MLPGLSTPGRAAACGPMGSTSSATGQTYGRTRVVAMRGTLRAGIHSAGTLPVSQALDSVVCPMPLTAMQGWDPCMG